MSNSTFSRHIARLRSSLSAHSHSTICEFLTEHTYLRGKKFSFDGHEYQRQILEDPSPHKVIPKSAQMGISEMMARLALAKAVLVNGFSTIYTLPAASAAQNFMKTRIDPIIDSSPYLSELVNKDVDNSSIKRFGTDSYLYLKGAQVDRQAISVPADLVVMDEVNNSNADVLTLYESRLIHSLHTPGGETVKLSTPTVPGIGIDVAYKQSRRHVNMCKCVACNHWFLPDYYEHVKVPDFDEDLRSITKAHFANPKFRWAEAYVMCPHCGAPANLLPEHRQWVLENPEDTFIAAGYKVSPFDCPTVITAASLVKSSVDYARYTDFENQRLGISSEDRETTLSRAELDAVIISEYPGGGHSYVMGVDLGMICWITIAAVLPGNLMILVHVEGVPLYDLRSRRMELARQYRVRMTVSDANPYTETVYQMQQEDANLFAAIYVRSKTIDLFKVQDRDENKDKAVPSLRQVNIVRDKVFDLIMMQVRTGLILKVSDKHDEVWKSHLLDQKRVKEFSGEEMITVWRKTQGEDHLHHSLLYARVASLMLGVASGAFAGWPMVLGKFKVEEAKKR